jgi:hypothetical protein
VAAVDHAPAPNCGRLVRHHPPYWRVSGSPPDAPRLTSPPGRPGAAIDQSIRCRMVDTSRTVRRAGPRRIAASGRLPVECRGWTIPVTQCHRAATKRGGHGERTFASCSAVTQAMTDLGRDVSVRRSV